MAYMFCQCLTDGYVADYSIREYKNAKVKERILDSDLLAMIEIRLAIVQKIVTIPCFLSLH